jgi:hypothetical protein
MYSAEIISMGKRWREGAIAPVSAEVKGVQNTKMATRKY